MLAISTFVPSLLTYRLKWPSSRIRFLIDSIRMQQMSLQKVSITNICHMHDIYDVKFIADEETLILAFQNSIQKQVN